MKEDRKEAIYADLANRVLALDLKPGDALDEISLCTEYDISRTPMREILQRLSGEGYLVVRPNRGAIVSSMDLATMRSFFQSAPAVYSMIARLAAEQASAEKLEPLKDTQLKFTEAIHNGDAGAMVLLNHQFHEIVGDIAQSPYLQPSLKRLLIDHTRISQRFYRPRQKQSEDRIRIACEQHEQMIVAFEENDPDKAAELTVSHWELSRREIEKYVRPEPLSLDANFHISGAA